MTTSAPKNCPKFVLASASPRRKLLLEQAGYSFDVVVSDVDESKYSADNSTDLTQILALAKAKEVAVKLPGKLVMGSDTVVDCEGEIIGKPTDAADADRITRLLFSRPHDVITGVAVVRIRDNTEIVRSAVTRVFPRKLTEEQIAGHIRGGGWKGKAGAYGIQETGDEFVERIEGSYTNVIGLPMELVAEIFYFLTTDLTD